MKVLFADDSVLILDRLGELLCKYKQVEIVGALKNGNDTLEALLKLNPDLAIVDLNMPGLNGLEVIHEIRKVNKTLKIIVLTFFAIESYKNLAIREGADYFFSKAEEFDKVSLVVAEMLVSEKHKVLN
jgi:DNA-binding NarL/FixJ family response regulator